MFEGKILERLKLCFEVVKTEAIADPWNKGKVTKLVAKTGRRGSLAKG